MMNKFFQKIKDIFLQEDEAQYDPQMFGTMIVLVVFMAGVLFWILWTALVYQGGIFLKLQALWWVISGEKKLAELISPGLPVSMSIFAGWLANILSTLVIFGIIIFLYFYYQKRMTNIRNNAL